jgi:group I intron endonuclease
MIVYCATSPSGKKYIGITTYSLNIRQNQHRCDMKRSNKPFHNALNKYGFDSFVWEIIDTATSLEELNKKEIYWIEKFGCLAETEQGYNVCAGGDLRPRDPVWRSQSARSHGTVPFKGFTLDGQEVGTWDNASQCATELGLASRSVRTILSGTMRIHKGYTFIKVSDLEADPNLLATRVEDCKSRFLKKFDDKMSIDRGGKLFEVYDIEDDEVVGTWINVRKCGDDLEISHKSISNALHGRAKVVGGRYTFKFLTQEGGAE